MNAIFLSTTLLSNGYLIDGLMVALWLLLYQESASDSPSEEGTGVESKYGTHALRQQLATLSTSLSTLTRDKSKMESSFQADKKRLRVNCNYCWVRSCGIITCDENKQGLGWEGVVEIRGLVRNAPSTPS